MPHSLACKRRIQSVRPQQAVTKKTRPSLVARKENADPILPGGNMSASQETSQIKDQPTASTSSNKGKKKEKKVDVMNVDTSG